MKLTTKLARYINQIKPTIKKISKLCEEEKFFDYQKILKTYLDTDKICVNNKKNVKPSTIVGLSLLRNTDYISQIRAVEYLERVNLKTSTTSIRKLKKFLESINEV